MADMQAGPPAVVGKRPPSMYCSQALPLHRASGVSCSVQECVVFFR
jgi:hypothetical protein